MIRRLPRTAFAVPATAVLLASLSTGCVRAYRPPTADQPHALVKVRRVYPGPAGTTLRESVLVDGNQAFRTQNDSSLAAAPRTDAILVHPRPATLQVSASFFHPETKTVQETYYEQVPYTATKTYSCGSYSSGSYSSQTCTRTVTKYRSEMKTRWVTKTVKVGDGSCNSGLRLAPEDGHVYLVEYRYLGAGACRVSCFEQISAGPGAFRNARCPEAPAVNEAQ